MKGTNVKIAIDIDDTLFRNDVIPTVIDEFGYDPKLKIEYDFHMLSLPEDVRLECQRRFKLGEYMHNLKPIDGCRDRVQEWADQNHTLFCVTARDPLHTLGTNNMVKQYFPMIDYVILVGDFDKSRTYCKHEFDVVIDDSPDNVQQAIESGIEQVFFISNDKTPYNWRSRDKFKSIRNVFQVESVGDVIL
jgi:uncharacterized HAD superfamily protein